MPTLTREKSAVASLIEKGRRDAPWFIEHVIGSPLWSVQRDIARAVFSEPQVKVAAKACHASGKTYVGARVVLAFFYLYPQCKILTTAPTWTAVRKLLWSEISAAFAGMPAPLGGELLDTELRAGKDWWAMGLSTNEGVKFQGHHGDKVLIVLDEAPGVRPDIWEAIEGIRAGGDVRILALGNPTIASGPFYDAFTINRAAWHTFTIDAFDTPNFAGIESPDDLMALSDAAIAYAPAPYLVTRAWAREMLETAGPDSSLWQARVRGQFPLEGDDALISLAWLEAARYLEPTGTDGDYWAGLDVAGPGEDSSVLYIRRGGDILSMQAWKDADPRGEVLAALAPYRDKGIHVNVDSIGIGYNFARHIQDAGYAVHDINVGEAPRDKDKFANAKAEHYWGLRQRFQQGAIAGLTDEKTISQLTGIRYQHTPRGQVQIESKDQARKRGVKSPDRAEALMLCFIETRRSGAGVWFI